MAWNTSVRAKHTRGVISGSTAKAVSPTRPRVTLCNAPSLTERPIRGASMIKARSANEYMAHTFGAQYAWQRPREKGNSRLRICGICPLSAKGPNAVPKMAVIPAPSFRQLRN